MYNAKYTHFSKWALAGWSLAHPPRAGSLRQLDTPPPRFPRGGTTARSWTAPCSGIPRAAPGAGAAGRPRRTERTAEGTALPGRARQKARGANAAVPTPPHPDRARPACSPVAHLQLRAAPRPVPPGPSAAETAGPRPRRVAKGTAATRSHNAPRAVEHRRERRMRRAAAEAFAPVWVSPALRGCSRGKWRRKSRVGGLYCSCNSALFMQNV